MTGSNKNLSCGRNSKIRILLILLGFILSSLAYAGVQFDGKHYEWPRLALPRDAKYSTTITRTIKTPHLKIAIPYIDGAVKVLFIVPRFSVRPSIELCQRFDIKERHALVYRTKKLTGLEPKHIFYMPGVEADTVRKSINDGLAWNPEVIIVYGRNSRALYQKTNSKILQPLWKRRVLSSSR